MLKTFEGIGTFLVGLGVIYYGIRYMRMDKKVFDNAGVKVDFTKTPATFGFASKLTGTLIVLAGIACFLFGFSFFFK